MKLLKLTYAVCGILIVLASTANARPVQDGANAPHLVIESQTHDFGEVKTGTPLKWVFKVKNAGNADLLINNVSPG